MVKVIYPSLVEQAAVFLKREGIKAEKDEIYKEMIKNGTIDQYGNPTKEALKNGLVSDFTEKKGMKLIEFKKMYPIFKEFSAKEFAKYDGIWYVSGTVIDLLDKRCANKEYEEEAVAQMAMYFQQRNYEEPQTIGEFKGTIPEFRSIDDSHFHKRDGKLFIDATGLEATCKSVLSGKVKGNKKAAKDVMEYVKRLKGN